MISRYTKLRVRRKIRSQKKSIEKAGEAAGKQFDRRVLRRWRNLSSVRRFVAGWLLLVGLLIVGVFLQGRQLDSYYLTDLPTSGGVFREGIVGNITNMNPIFATSSADRAATKLQFNTLFTYDEDDRLVGDLAASFELSEDETIYTVNLKENVTWHDGEVFDADDVVFTYESIQHPDTRSYLNLGWSDVKVQKKDQFTVTFSLPNPFVPFPNSLAEGGIIPEHILGSVDPSQLRGHSFNTSEPVGTGPFMFAELVRDSVSNEQSTEQLRLDANPSYHLGEVQLDNFILTTYVDREVMVQRFVDGELASAGGLTSSDRQLLADNLDTVWYDLPLNNAVFVFYNTSEGVFVSEQTRRALTHAIDNVSVSDTVNNRYASLDSPILPNQLGYNPDFVQSAHSVELANRVLDEEGWRYREGEANDGVRYKGDQKLSINLITQNSDDFPQVARDIANHWRAVGVDAQVTAVNEGQIQSSYITPHNYEALLFGISLGSDPDPFAYWHSSQTGTNGFNLSEIEDERLDDALESGRTRSDPNLRAAKYHTFLERWFELTPAHVLYRPAYSYVQRKSVSGFDERTLNTPEQRYGDIQDWTVNTEETVQPY